jgi:hypothetical protein
VFKALCNILKLVKFLKGTKTCLIQKSYVRIFQISVLFVLGVMIRKVNFDCQEFLARGRGAAVALQDNVSK